MQTVSAGIQAVDVTEERQRIIETLSSCGGNQAEAARALGVSRRTLINRLEEYGVPRPRRR